MKSNEDKSKSLISVIIPVYNVEDYVEICLKSILGQSYKVLEILLIDDGSTDGSGKILDRYGKQDARIKVIHQKNTGLAGARNTGLQYATGEYVSFVDSDDYMDPFAYEKLLAYIENHLCDICYFGHYRVNNGDRIPVDCPPEKLIYEGVDETIGSLITKALSGKSGVGNCFTGLSVCCALYRRAILEQNSLWFESEREILSEDILFNMQAILYSEHVMVYPDYLYYYTVRMQSLTKSYRADRFEAALRMDLRLRELADTHQLQTIFENGLLNAYAMNLIVCLKQEMQFERQNGYRHVMKRIKYIGSHRRTKEFLKKKKVAHGLQQKILFFCLRCSFWHLVFLILKAKNLHKGVE